MIAAVSRSVGVTALIAVALIYVFVPGARAPGAGHRLLDPNDPVAADGSLIAGRAHTIFDTEAYGAFKPAPRADSDDPADFEPIIKLDRGWAVTYRAQFKPLLSRLDASLCKGSDHQQLMWAVRNYYGTRGREKHNFSVRGPRAAAAIEAEWSTPADLQIDDYVRHALHYGLLHKTDFPAKTYPEFAKTFADAEEFGAGCTGADR
jgi:hypothetical protein